MMDVYPSSPQSVPADLTKPTTTYLRRAWVAVASLVLFVVLYAVLTGWFIWTAQRMILAAIEGGPNALVNALVAAGATFLAIFMLKAVFFVKRGGSIDLVEVTAKAQPRLFEFLHKIADEVGAPRPNKVFLSARVNAAVFYDISVLNLFFPSKKNLEIGLALINVLTLSETKAVLAHEFGHFAQRSMAIGIWVYIAQQIASHIIAKRDALDKLLRFISRVDLRVAWVGWLMTLIVWSIRSLMDSFLSLVVLAQRALSRQMEFQADLVAVSVAGSDEIVNALYKLNAADESWRRALDFTGAELSAGGVPHDIFAVQSRIIERVSQILDDESYGKAPKRGTDNQRVFKDAHAQPPQMWSTHPSNPDREENAKRHHVIGSHDDRSAWLLFDDIEAVKRNVVGKLFDGGAAKPLSAEQTFQSLDQRYSSKQYESRYRGAYLGRELTRHTVDSAELYAAALTHDNVLQAIASLYPVELPEQLAKLRELCSERVALEALHLKVYEAKGGKIIHRGKEISRRELPDAIRGVTQEEEAVRAFIVRHDQDCRSAHLAAAEQLGGGWKEYLIGLIGVLHYAEHTYANLRDAQALFRNVLAVVTADGKVSKRELNRLITTANSLHAVLAEIYANKTFVELDHLLCEQLKVSNWPEALGDLTLPAATTGNINEWIPASDNWVGGVASLVSSLGNAALEQLLLTEDMVVRSLRDQKKIAAPKPSTVGVGYPTIVAGQERKKQRKLDLWDRFQTADGVVPASARLLVASVIVGAVLFFGAVTGVTSVLTIYNGLGVPVVVDVAAQKHAIAPFSSASFDIELKPGVVVATRTAEGRAIESFQPELRGLSQHYVYNVAGASPLVEWTAVYGNAVERPARHLGAKRWLTSSADFFFVDPPDSVKTKGGGASRDVLSGMGELAPSDVLGVVGDASERDQVIAAHAKWDADTAVHASEWRAISVH